MIHIARSRGAFKSDPAKDWVFDLLQNLSPGVRVDSVVLICDCTLSPQDESSEHEFPRFTICHLELYSPQVNSVESMWSKMKAEEKQRMRVPQVQALE